VTAAAVPSAVAVSWSVRPLPLAPVAVLAIGGDVASRLVQRLLRDDDAALARLRGVASQRAVLVLSDAGSNGDAAAVHAGALPWIDGLRYLGRDPRAPGLLLPTVFEPDVALALLERSLALRVPEATRARTPAPWAIWHDPSVVIPAGAARPLVREALERWLQERAAPPEPQEDER
jgi:hypothetical protein